MEERYKVAVEEIAKMRERIGNQEKQIKQLSLEIKD